MRPVRVAGVKPISNVLFNYGHTTIPRHLRDIVITEYGMADLRSKNDNQIAKALICIADSRFQAGLLAAAKKVGKIESEWRIPAPSLRNTPDALAESLRPYRVQGVLPLFPLGSDFYELNKAVLPHDRQS